MAEKIIYTMDYESLKDLFIKSGLEIHEEDPAPEGLVTCFKLIDEETGKRLGAAGLVLNHKNEYILRCVAVEEEHRGKGVDKILHDKNVDSDIYRKDFAKERTDYWKARANQILEERGQMNNA